MLGKHRRMAMLDMLTDEDASVIVVYRAPINLKAYVR